MSVRMRTLHTKDLIEVVVNSDVCKKFIIPQSAALKLFDFLSKLQTQNGNNELINADEMFSHLDKKYGKVGATIRGFRFRDGLTQKDLACKLKIHQTHVSQIEHGKRVVGKNLAHKFAKVFDTDYRLFL